MRSRNVVESFGHAFAGLWYALRSERNTRIHLVIAIAAIALGLWLGLGTTEWAVIALTIGLVLTCEMINTVTETLVDLVSPDYHPLAKVIKDLTAGAVLVTAITAVVVGLLILGPPLWVRLLAGS